MAKITDVARAAGVSIATVSRVLNQPSTVVQDKRERVLAAVRELQYSPNRLAHALRAGQVMSVALLVADISQPFHGALAKALDREGERLGYRVLLRDLDHKQERLLKALGELRTSDTYGVVLATPDNLSTPVIRNAIAQAQERGLVVVCSSQIIVDSDVPAVLPRYQAISHLATQHLVTSGVGPIIFVGGGDESPLSLERRSGFEQACRELGHLLEPDLILDGRFTVGGSYQATLEALDRQQNRMQHPGTRPIGIIAVNFTMAIGAMQAAAERGLLVPRDIRLVCCEELPLATAWHPPITTVGIDFATLAAATFAALVAGRKAPRVTPVPHRLVVRASSQPPVAGKGAPGA